MSDEVLLGYLLPAALAGATAIVGATWGLMRWSLRRVLADIERRVDQIGEIAQRSRQVEERLQQLLTEMPQHYQRRDETMRQIEQVEARYQQAVDSVIAVLRERVQDSERRLSVTERTIEEGKREYQRRDDSIREYTSMNAKLDRIYDAMLEARHGR